jgi:4,5-DOPA dioxygenase extradiol
VQAISVDPKQRQAKMNELLKRDDARKAHPSLEHILPMYIAAGAAGSDVGERIWAMPEASLNWAQYRFWNVGIA